MWLGFWSIGPNSFTTTDYETHACSDAGAQVLAAHSGFHTRGFRPAPDGPALCRSGQAARHGSRSRGVLHLPLLEGRSAATGHVGPEGRAVDSPQLRRPRHENRDPVAVRTIS